MFHFTFISIVLDVATRLSFTHCFLSCLEPSKNLVVVNRSLLSEKYNVSRFPFIHLLFFEAQKEKNICGLIAKNILVIILFFQGIHFLFTILSHRPKLDLAPKRKTVNASVTSGPVATNVNFQCSGYNESHMQPKITSQVILGKIYFLDCRYFWI